ncbi:MAG: redox-sensing transcriptional repressor Rex [Treponema sp.]|nr:redox-sensing transcriptional repressor Rex [Treponema sp.]
MEKIPEASRRRLALLAALLASYKEEKITSIQMQKMTGVERALIRKDISLAGFKGGVSNGYKATDLLAAIRAALKLPLPEEKRFCCIAGLGKLGAALMQCGIFDESPFKIVAGFDSRVNRTEVLSADFPLYPAAKMETVVPEAKIEFAILAVEDEQAKMMADRLVKSGVKGIVNFTGQVLEAPEGVAVENVSPLLALNNICARVSGNAVERKPTNVG